MDSNHRHSAYETELEPTPVHPAISEYKTKVSISINRIFTRLVNSFLLKLYPLNPKSLHQKSSRQNHPHYP